MLNYKDYEEKVYNWLQEKHNNDNNFTFSLRQKSTKGAETISLLVKKNLNLAN